ncbi:MAG: septum formation protein Maf [Nitrospinae bacterium]|nr:septum formation protein Maf [Nitrospinota bacterium]
MTVARTPVILASQSPRRIELLKQLVADFRVIPSEVVEVFRADLSPEENAVTLGREKADWVARRHPGHCVIGADTVVVLDGEIIGKPTDTDDAHRILKRLSGREHQVITGVAVLHSKTASAAAVSRVRMKSLTREEITAYINSGEPMDKAGAYAIQGKGASLIAGYDGSYSNIVGLPVETLKDLLQRAGYSIEEAS